MANNIGDVNVRVTADAGQFRAAMQGASATMKQLRADVALATRDFRAGKISGEDYAVAIKYAREQATLLRNEQRLLAPASLGVARGIGTVRSSLASLAAMSLGVKGTFGTLTSALLFMSVGNLTAIGVIAGVAALVKGYQLLKEKSEKAAEAAKKASAEIREAWSRLPEPALAMARSDQAVARARLADVSARYEAARFPLGRGGPEMTPSAALATELRDARRAVEAADAAIANMTQSAREADQAFANATSNLDALRQAAERAIAEFNRFNPFRASILPTDEGPLDRGAALMRAQAMEQRLRRQGEELRRRLTQPWRDQQAAQEMSEVGELWARSILTSMVRAFRDGNVGKAFANVFGTLLEQIIVSAIIKGLQSAKGGPLGFLGKLLSFDTGGVVPGRSGQAQLAVVHGGETVMPTRGGSGVFQVAVPQLAGPALITNAEWQRIWRDTAREATRQGFRMAVI